MTFNYSGQEKHLFPCLWEIAGKSWGLLGSRLLKIGGANSCVVRCPCAINGVPVWCSDFEPVPTFCCSWALRSMYLDPMNLWDATVALPALWWCVVKPFTTCHAIAKANSPHTCQEEAETKRRSQRWQRVSRRLCVWEAVGELCLC